jgi:hypothetical protein
METSTIRSAENQPSGDTSRKVSGIAFPYYSLADTVLVAKAIHDKGGGSASRDQAAAFLGYRSTQNGAFLTRISAGRVFGLVTESNKELRVTTLGYKIISPESAEQHREGLVESFLTVPLFKAIYDEYRGRDLPEGLGLKNALRLKFQIVPKKIDLAYRLLYESAEVAGFFETRGSKTQLVMPVIKFGAAKSPDIPKDPDIKHGGGGDEPPGGDPPRLTKSRDDLQNEYIETLIGVLKEKSKSGEMDDQLMVRIERLLELKSA